jgi:cardiolipin synthase
MNLPTLGTGAAPTWLAMSQPQREATSVRRLAAFGAGLLTTLSCLVACAALPSPPEAASAPLSKAQTRDRIQVIGAQGPDSAQAEAAALARVKAEGSAALLQRHLEVLVAHGDVNLYRGNSVRLLVDGPQTFAAMKAAVAAARERVLVEFYIVEDEGIAVELGELLMQKAAQGVSVALLYDSLGSFGTSTAFFDRLRAGGVWVCAFNPVNPLQRPGHWEVVARNHRKMLAVDNDVAFTGGINLSTVYAKGSFSSARRPRAPPSDEEVARSGWRDTQIELRGPVVPAMTASFRSSWQSQGCPGVLPTPPPPVKPAPGQRVVRLVTGDPDHGINPTYTVLLKATQAAARSVHLTMAYFAPGPEMIGALSDAARRGVDVRLVLPSQTDVSLVLHAARSYYAQLLEAGVQIYEMEHAVMHAKTAVIDGVLSTVGSSNLDWRSIVSNSEMDVIVLGDDFAGEMQSLFKRDQAASRRIEAQQWSQRGIGKRLMEALGRLLEPWL